MGGTAASSKAQLGSTAKTFPDGSDPAAIEHIDGAAHATVAVGTPRLAELRMTDRPIGQMGEGFREAEGDGVVH